MLLGTTLAILDSSILNILVVPIMQEFQADLGAIEWVLTSYNLAFAVFMIGLGELPRLLVEPARGRRYRPCDPCADPGLHRVSGRGTRRPGRGRLQDGQ